MKNFIHRALFGSIYVALIIAGLFFGEYSFLALILLLATLSIQEFNKLTFTWATAVSKTMLYLVVLGAGIISFFVNFKQLPSSWLLLPALVPLFFFISLLYRNTDKLFAQMGVFLLGMFYLALPFALVFRLVNIHESYNYSVLLGVFVLQWASDSFAYLFGVLFGKRKLFERISPKKSWEGFIGGAISTIIISYFMADYLPAIPVFAWLLIAVVITVFGVYGDLLESAMKRLQDIKDSGSIIPGHGGILDRLDSFLISLPVVVTVLLLIFEI